MSVSADIIYDVWWCNWSGKKLAIQ